MDFAFVGQIIGLYKIILLVRIILTWIPHNPQNPAATFLYKITEPILEPVRRLIPSIGGMDISPIIVFFALSLIQKGFQLVTSITKFIVPDKMGHFYIAHQALITSFPYIQMFKFIPKLRGFFYILVAGFLLARTGPNSYRLVACVSQIRQLHVVLVSCATLRYTQSRP